MVAEVRLIYAYYNTHILDIKVQLRYCLSMGHETNTRKIIARLEREGWVKTHGGRHDKFDHTDRKEVTLIVPRHRELSPGVARDIAKKAGWIK